MLGLKLLAIGDHHEAISSFEDNVTNGTAPEEPTETVILRSTCSAVFPSLQLQGRQQNRCLEKSIPGQPRPMAMHSNYRGPVSCSQLQL